MHATLQAVAAGIRALTSGTLVDVDAAGRATFLACPWAVEVAAPADAEWYPEEPGQVWAIADCGARMRQFVRPGCTDGSVCENGHEFGNMEARLGPGGLEWQAEQADRAAWAR